MNPFRRFTTMHRGWFRLLVVTYFFGWILVLTVMAWINNIHDEAPYIIGFWLITFWPAARLFLWIKDGFTAERPKSP